MISPLLHNIFNISLTSGVNYILIYEMWLYDLFYPQFCKFDMSKYGYLNVFHRVPWIEITRVDCIWLKNVFSRAASALFLFFVVFLNIWTLLSYCTYHNWDRIS